MTLPLSYTEASKRLSEIADQLEKDRFVEGGINSVTVEESGRLRLKVVESDIFDCFIRIFDELNSLAMTDDGPEAFGLLQNSFDKFPLPFEQKKRMGNAFLSFMGRTDLCPMNWVPGSPQYVVKSSDTRDEGSKGRTV